MTKKKPSEIRSASKDGAFATVEAYRKKRKGAPAKKAPRFRQPEERVVQRFTRTLREGYPRLLGATVHGDGINFAVYSRHARDIFLVLFDAPDAPPTDVIRLPARTGNVHHGFVEGLGPGQLYGFRARGEFNPAKGFRFNENKLLIDPYARAFAGRFRHDGNVLLPYDANAAEKDYALDERDSADAVPKCIAYSEAFDWEGDAPPRIPMAETILYEVHVKGFTAHESSRVRHPGTYAGFAEKIPYLKDLGINAVELLPVQAKFPAEREGENGKGNYWGYNTFGFFAPEATYASGREPGCEVREFKALVKALHKAGIEVILDVVYNHSAEGNELGPLISFKGLDNPSYYALTGSGTEPARYYFNHSGTGNTLDFGSPPVVRMALDSLRYWVEEMHVDGFRFDLALVHGRGFWSGFEARAPFFQALAQDPVLSGVKLIAEPWDCGGFEQGNFPVGWAEWNARFRDNARRFIKGDAGQINELGWRLTGSADLFGDDGRGPDSSLNFVTCHDGFTLNDLVSYDGKHNEANGEGNRDGYDDNLSWNCGAEGDTGDGTVLSLRRRQVRNFACLMLFAQGTPMLGHGDEVLRTQHGNNNAYCQDNPLAWMDWGLLERNRDMFEFVKKAIDLRKRIPLLMGKAFLEGKDGPAGIPDIAWYGPQGKGLDWNHPECRSLAFQLDGNEWTFEEELETQARPGVDGPPADRPERKPMRKDRRFYFIYNMESREQEFTLPILPEGREWRRLADTSLPPGEDFRTLGKEEPLIHPGLYRVKARSVVILKE
ncbi:MAG TPA: glycogen debranching protein GlgX [Fibrobacteria bacterium]|nr:glycogen debranching protein GlgX [Fibrobacteria bacterium]